MTEILNVLVWLTVTAVVCAVGFIGIMTIWFDQLEEKVKMFAVKNRIFSRTVFVVLCFLTTAAEVIRQRIARRKQVKNFRAK